MIHSYLVHFSVYYWVHFIISSKVQFSSFLIHFWLIFAWLLIHFQLKFGLYLIPFWFIILLHFFVKLVYERPLSSLLATSFISFWIEKNIDQLGSTVKLLTTTTFDISSARWRIFGNPLPNLSFRTFQTCWLRSAFTDFRNFSLCFPKVKDKQVTRLNLERNLESQ